MDNHELPEYFVATHVLTCWQHPSGPKIELAAMLLGIALVTDMEYYQEIPPSFYMVNDKLYFIGIEINGTDGDMRATVRKLGE